MSRVPVAEATKFVIGCIDRIKYLLPTYWEKTLEQRLSTSSAGSCYTQFNSAEELEAALRSCEWEETSHPAVDPSCRVFKTQLEGHFGLVRIADLPSDAILMADDRKATGRISATIMMDKPASLVAETYAICGIEQGQWVVFTFHPGEPIRPSQVEAGTHPHGSIMSREQALALGLEWAKIV